MRAGANEAFWQVFANRRGESGTSFSVGFRVDDVAGARLRDARPRLSVSSVASASAVFPKYVSRKDRIGRV